MNLFDLIKQKNKEVEFAPLQPQQEQQVDLLPIALNDDGTTKENVVYTPEVKPKRQGLNLVDVILGKKAAPTDSVSDMSVTISNNPRSGGILRDIANGYQENRFNPVSLENFGQKKNLATRFGEGLGSLARFAESPLGRSVIVGGLVGATGGNPLQMLSYGAQTGAQNQMYRNNDKLYRNDLIQNAKQQLINSPEFNTLNDTEKAQILTDLQNDANFTALTDENSKQNMIDEATRAYLTNRQNNQLKDVEDNINNMRGYVTNDTYNNLMKSQQIRDNYAYRNMMLNNQLEQNKIMNQLRQDQFKAQQEQNAFNNYIKERDLQEKANDRAFRASEGAANRAVQMRGQDISASKETAADRKAREKEKQAMSTINVINQAKKAVSNNPNAFKWTTGALGAEVANRIDPKGVLARSIVNSVTAEHRKYLTGAQMSDSERKDFDKFLPAPTDNARIIQDKLDGMLTVISAREGLSSRGDDPLGIR